MHQVLKYYVQRFQKEETSNKQISSFFSQLKPDDYIQELPFMYDLENALLRLLIALLKDEKICIFSDYDTDAVTATAVMYHGLVELGFKKENLSFYAPDRFVEGYGMNTDAIKNLCQKNDLIISVDCGINSVEEAKAAKELNKDLIITDHHHLHSDLPKCLSVINPRLSDYYKNENLPKVNNKLFERIAAKNESDKIEKINDWLKKMEKRSKDVQKNSADSLSKSTTGVGVAWFTLLWFGYFLQEIGLFDRSLVKFNSLLSLVAIGTIADCQSILDPTNRLLVKSGIQIIATEKYDIPGLKSLMEKTGILAKMKQGYFFNSQDIAFYLSPILNSSGRLTHAKLSIQVLIEDNHSKADQLSQELIEVNERRKEMVNNIYFEVNELAKIQAEKEDSIWLNGDWNKGVIGLLASKLVNIYDKPVIVASKEDGKIVASLRAPEDFHLPNAMKYGEKYLLKFGGHPGAAGFTTTEENLKKAKKLILEGLKKQYNSLKSEKREQYLDQKLFQILPSNLLNYTNKKNLIWLEPQELENNLFQNLLNLDPFGQDFPFPNFVTYINSLNFRWLGNEQKHAKFRLPNNQTITAFNLDEEIKDSLIQSMQNKITTKFQLWFQVKLVQNVWNGKTQNELIAENIWLYSSMT